VWNRSSHRADPLRALGAQVAQSAAEVFDRAPVVILMLANAAAIDTVLGRGTPQFAHMLAGRTVIHVGTTSPG
jgi:3-hydroxyisobutyrate dehydrogenase